MCSYNLFAHLECLMYFSYFSIDFHCQPVFIFFFFSLCSDARTRKPRECTRLCNFFFKTFIFLASVTEKQPIQMSVCSQGLPEESEPQAKICRAFSVWVHFILSLSVAQSEMWITSWIYYYRLYFLKTFED